MMTGLRYLAAPLYRRIYRALAPAPNGFRALILHDVRLEEIGAFTDLITYLDQEHGILTPEEAEVILSGESSPPPEGRTPWLLTFDDGFVSNYEIAQSVLAPRGIRALFFVCPGLIDVHPAKRREVVNNKIYPDDWKPASPVPRLMNWDEIRAMRDLGHSIGSHSMMHHRLSRLTPEELEGDVKRSAIRLAQELGREPIWFAFPFGNLDSTSEAVLAAAARHFRFCCSGIRGVNASTTHRAGILREGIDLSAPREYLRLIADGGLGILYRSHRKHLSRMTAAVPR